MAGTYDSLCADTICNEVISVTAVKQSFLSFALWHSDTRSSGSITIIISVLVSFYGGSEHAELIFVTAKLAY